MNRVPGMVSRPDASFADILRRSRRDAGLTQEVLAEKAGLSARAISDLERGINRAPRRDTLLMLAQALDLDADERAAWERARKRYAARSVLPDPTEDRQSNAHLPAAITSFVGRDSEVEQVASHILREGVRLVTLTGPGGAGKTRLALESARHVAGAFPGGAWFVNLAPLGDHRHVLQTIATTINVPVNVSERVLVALTDALASQRTLLLLDNLEHVIDCAIDIWRLLQACPGLTVLATSRAPLRLGGEQEYVVGPLSVPGVEPETSGTAACSSGALDLFVMRAGEVRPDFMLSDANAAAVASICRRLDGMPLAIELAAACIRFLPPRAILGRLEHSLSLLTGGAVDLPVRQRTLRNTIGWSYDLLPVDCQRVFRRMSVFRGGWTLDALENVCGETNAVRMLERLVEHSLVRVRDVPDGEPRYSMLETIREFAMEQLAREGEEVAARDSHGHYFLEMAERAITSWRRRSPDDPYTRMRLEVDNLRSAQEWFVQHDPVAACRLSGALWRFFALFGSYDEGRQWLETSLSAAHDLPPAVRARVLEGIATMAYLMTEYDVVRSSLEEALPLWEQVGDPGGQAWAYHGFGRMAYETGNYPYAKSCYNQALELYRELGDPVGIADMLNVLGVIAAAVDDLDDAWDHYQESLALRRESGDRFGMYQSLSNLGCIAMSRGDYQPAGTLFEEALELGRVHGLRAAVWHEHLHLGQLALHLSDPEQARAHLTESIGGFQKEQSRLWIVKCLMAFGWLAALEHRLEDVALIDGAIQSAVRHWDISLPPAEVATYEQSIASARPRLSPDAWTSSESRGRTMTLDAIVNHVVAGHPRGS